jgi:hypothetical protein
MKDRCNNPRNNRFYAYGARGIKFCKRWESFSNFIADMGLKPTPKHSLDRINTDGDYAPTNCRWADGITQANNCRSNHFLELNGTRKTLAQWARELGVSALTLKSRLVYGWTDEEALTKPIRRMA